MSMNINETRKYYESMTAQDMCQCGNCQNFYRRISETYPEVAAFLSDLGVDIEKPHEAWAIEIENDKLMYPDVQYVVMGSKSDFKETEISGVKIYLADSYPPTDVDEEHFVIESGPYYLKNKAR